MLIKQKHIDTEEITMFVGIKIGSSSLVNSKGEIRKKIILTLCEQIADLINDGHRVFLVCSGAVASDPNKKRSKQLRAAIGQIRLMAKFSPLLEIFNIDLALILLTDNDLTADFKKTVLESISGKKQKVLVVLNANDPVDSAELKALEICADNDHLFSLVAKMLKIDIAIIGIDKPGLLDKNKVVRVVEGDIQKFINLTKGRNKCGTGGMKSKICILNDLSKNKIYSVMAPVKEKNFIIRAVKKEKNFGTIFPPI